MEKRTMKTKHHKLQFADLPTDYAGLCGLLVPRPIHDRAGYGNALEILEAMAGFEEKFHEDQSDYFAAIADFVAAYEASMDTRRSPRHPLDMLKYLLQENGMTAADLSRLLGADRTLGGKILRGERNLTVPHLRILSERFKVDPSLFI
jgi:antitoxin component HigA of HigAB toxin-antitoxin module